MEKENPISDKSRLSEHMKETVEQGSVKSVLVIV